MSNTPIYDQLVAEHGHDPLTRWATPSLTDNELARFHKQIEEVLAGAWRKGLDTTIDRLTVTGWEAGAAARDQFARHFEQWTTGKHWRWQQP